VPVDLVEANPSNQRALKLDFNRELVSDRPILRCRRSWHRAIQPSTSDLSYGCGTNASHLAILKSFKLRASGSISCETQSLSVKRGVSILTASSPFASDGAKIPGASESARAQPRCLPSCEWDCAERADLLFRARSSPSGRQPKPRARLESRHPCGSSIVRRASLLPKVLLGSPRLARSE
jgi:hypothetical protein